MAVIAVGAAVGGSFIPGMYVLLVHKILLLPAAELADRHVSSPSQVVTEGEHVQVKVTNVDIARRRLSLSVRQALDEIGFEGREAPKGAEAGAILDQEAQPPPNEELQKLAALQFEDETVGL